jgi:hypothetical protein
MEGANLEVANIYNPLVSEGGMQKYVRIQPQGGQHITD